MNSINTLNMIHDTTYATFMFWKYILTKHSCVKIYSSSVGYHISLFDIDCLYHIMNTTNILNMIHDTSQATLMFWEYNTTQHSCIEIY